MKPRHVTLVLLIATLFGFLGGVLSTHLPVVSLVLAQREERQQEVISARLVCGEEFRLLNRQGVLRAKFEVTPGDGIVVAFYHKDGKRRTVYEFTTDGVPRLRF